MWDRTTKTISHKEVDSILTKHRDHFKMEYNLVGVIHDLKQLDNPTPEESAKEMFEELGYHCTVSDWQIQYKLKINWDYLINFNLNTRMYKFWYVGNKFGESPMDTTPMVHKAIHQQLKELGWL